MEENKIKYYKNVSINHKKSAGKKNCENSSDEPNIYYISENIWLAVSTR